MCPHLLSISVDIKFSTSKSFFRLFFWILLLNQFLICLSFQSFSRVFFPDIIWKFSLSSFIALVLQRTSNRRHSWMVGFWLLDQSRDCYRSEQCSFSKKHLNHYFNKNVCLSMRSFLSRHTRVPSSIFSNVNIFKQNTTILVETNCIITDNGRQLF